MAANEYLKFIYDNKLIENGNIYVTDKQAIAGEIGRFVVKGDKEGLEAYIKELKSKKASDSEPLDLAAKTALDDVLEQIKVANKNAKDVNALMDETLSALTTSNEKNEKLEKIIEDLKSKKPVEKAPDTSTNKGAK